MAEWHVTPHAVRRFMDLYAPGRMSQAAAERILAEYSEIATYVKPLAKPGRHLYRVRRPFRLRFVVADPHHEGQLPALITVMPDHDGAYDRRGQ